LAVSIITTISVYIHLSNRHQTARIIVSLILIIVSLIFIIVSLIFISLIIIVVSLIIIVVSLIIIVVIHYARQPVDEDGPGPAGRHGVDANAEERLLRPQVP
jgi:heme/copper-type cytochrome/quinol oxidase subunit 2